MATIQELYTQSLLSLAAYADLSKARVGRNSAAYYAA
jgi:hypothetical protein